jgi:hypothetical protein
MINRTFLVGGMLAAGLLACSSKSDNGSGSGGSHTGTGASPAAGSPSAGNAAHGGATIMGTGGTAGSITGGATGQTGGSGNGGLAACPTYANLPTTCASTTTAASLKKVNTLLVVDKSGSMSDQPTGFSQNKWVALTDALSTVLTDTQRLMAYGLELFPAKTVTASCTDKCCEMPGTGFVDAAIPAGVSSIIDVLNTTAPGGGTPTAEALRSALNYFTIGAGSGLVGQKVVLLATDGGPNCNTSFTQGCTADVCTNNIDGRPVGCDATFNCCDTTKGGQATGCLDTDAVVAAIQALAAAKIPTVVLGIPGTELYTNVMDLMAQAGGMPNPAVGAHSYYAANASAGVQGLSDVIRQITVQLVQQCDLQLDQEPQDPDLVAVAINCSLIKRSSKDGGVGQWTLDTTTSPPTVKLLGDTCTNVRTNGVQRVDVLLGCAGPVG